MPHNVITVEVAVLVNILTRLNCKDIVHGLSPLPIIINTRIRLIQHRLIIVVVGGISSTIQWLLVKALHTREVPTHDHEGHLQDELTAGKSNRQSCLLNQILNQV